MNKPTRFLTLSLGISIGAFLAQEAQAAPPLSIEAGTPALAPDAPPARTGFQLALRTGYAMPSGDADGESGGSMSNAFSGQVPFIVDIGGKPVPELFLGSYFGLGVGGAAGDFKRACSGITCTAVSVRLGVEAQFHFTPAAKIDPWLGYGLGYEVTSLSMSGSGGSASMSFSGPEYAHLMFGVDSRINSTFGVGGFVDYSVGEYTRLSLDAPGGMHEEGPINTTTTHQWATLGVRFLFFP